MSKLLRLHLQYFGGEDGQGSGENNPPEPNVNTNTNNEPPKEPERTFTQAEVSAMMAREKEQGRKSVLKELGVEDLSSAKKGLDQYKKLLDSQKTDLEKAREGEKAALANSEELRKELSASNQKLSVLMAGCQASKVNDVTLLAQARVTENLPFDKAIEQVKKEYPSFFEDSTPKGTGGTLNPQNRGGSDSEGLGARLASQSKNAYSGKNPYFNS